MYRGVRIRKSIVNFCKFSFIHFFFKIIYGDERSSLMFENEYVKFINLKILI